MTTNPTPVSGDESVSDDHTDTGATQPLVRVLRGQPTDVEVAALVAVVAGAGGGAGEPGPVLRNLWGHPVDKLRYGAPSWQRVTLLERTHIRR